MGSIFDSKRLNIFIGAYGSGKSEISVNCAVGIKNRNPEAKVLLADLDIVNPFYRSADAARKLENLDIRIISPSYANSNVDVPALSGEVYSIFDDESYVGVFDIGGEDMGANVLGSMHNRLLGIDYNLLMVINTLRPFTSDEDSIIEMAKDLEAAAKLPITGFINNTNLLDETEFEDIVKGNTIINNVSAKVGIPLVATSVVEGKFTPNQLAELNNPGEFLCIKRNISYNY
ncbi:MAG: hypothetical protein J6U54_22615 [Clostridiales bacterium]|nr:hypothetical protein [Clostridiales bacterium]